MQKKSVMQSIFLCTFLSACASPMQQSSSLNNDYLTKPGDKEAVRGIPYYLPDTVIPIKVSGDFQVLPDRKPKDPKINPNPQDYEYVLTFTIDETKQIPDPNTRMLLEYNLSIRSSDEFRLGVTKNGLLNTVKSLSEDKSGEVIIKLAELAKEAAKIALFTTPISEQKLIKKQSPDERRKACYDQLKKMSVSLIINASQFLMLKTKSESQSVDKISNEYSFLIKEKIEKFNSKIIEAMMVDGTESFGKFNLISDVNFDSKKTETLDIGKAEEIDYKRGIVFRVMEPTNLQVTMDTSDLEFRKGNQTCTLPKIVESVDTLPMMVANH